MKYRVQNEVAAQMNSWRARRHNMFYQRMSSQLMSKSTHVVSRLVVSYLDLDFACGKCSSNLCVR